MNEEKPSVLVNLTLLLIVVLFLGGLGWAGTWAYKKFFGSDEDVNVAVVESAATDPAQTEADQDDAERAQQKKLEEAKQKFEVGRISETVADKQQVDVGVVADRKAAGAGSAETGKSEAAQSKSQAQASGSGDDNKAGAGAGDDKVADSKLAASGSDGKPKGKDDKMAASAGAEPDGGDKKSASVANDSAAAGASVKAAVSAVAAVDAKGDKPDSSAATMKAEKQAGPADGSGQATAQPLPPRPPADKEFAKFEKGDVEAEDLRADAMRRIEEAPDDLYSARDKYLVKKGLENAGKTVRICTVYFTISKDELTEDEVGRLRQALAGDEMKELSGDPKAVFFVLGFADPSGDPGYNKKLSMSRAQAVVDRLKGDLNVKNKIHPVAIGPSELISKSNQEKNRAAEVWGVFP